MEVLVPITITDAMITSISVAEDPTAPWVAGTYAADALCHRPNTHRVYRRIDAGTSATPPESDAPHWQDLRPTNRWSMFDKEVATATTATNTLSLVIKPGNANAVALVGISGGEGLTVVTRDAPGGNVISTYTDALEESAPSDWWEYWFMPFKPRTAVLVADIEPYLGMEITITLTGSGTVGCAMCVVGDLRPLGDTQFDAECQLVDYSYVDIDKSTGKNTIQKGKTAQDLSAEVLLDASEANRVKDTMVEVLGQPCLYVPSRYSQYRYLWTYGLGAGKVKPKSAKEASLPLTVQGLI